MASLDHAMWFHRPFRVDEWVLYDTSSPSASGARGLGTGHFFAAGRPDAGHRGAGGPGPAAMSGVHPAVDLPAAAGEPTTVLALKEWAAVVHALLDGRQTVLLRKGGIHEKRFSLRGSRFVVFPTVAHSHLESTRAGACRPAAAGFGGRHRIRRIPGGAGRSRGRRGHRRAPAGPDRRPGTVPHLDHGIGAPQPDRLPAAARAERHRGPRPTAGRSGDRAPAAGVRRVPELGRPGSGFVRRSCLGSGRFTTTLCCWTSPSRSAPPSGRRSAPTFPEDHHLGRKCVAW